MSTDIELRLFAQSQKMRGVTHTEKLDSIGLDDLIELIGMGHKLKTRDSARKPGILNTLNVPEDVFYAWLIRQPTGSQDKFHNAAIIQKNRRKEDIIEQIEEITENYDELLADYRKSPEYDYTEESKILDKQAKVCSNLLKELTNIERTEKDSERQDVTPKGDINIHVHANQNQLERLKQLEKGKNNE